MQKQTEITKPRAETLAYILESGGTVIGHGDIAEARDVGTEAQRRLCNRMANDGLLEIESHPNGSIITFSETGKDLAIEIGYGPLDVGEGAESDRLVRRLHGITLHVSIKNRERLPDRWRSILAERSDLKWTQVQEYDAETDMMIAYKKRWVMRFHRTSVTLQMKKGEAIERFSTAECFRELVERARDAIRWIRQMTGLQVDMQDVEIGRAECAFEEHHLALLADTLPGLRMDDIVVHDKVTEKPAAKIDKSKTPEVETLTGERSEDIANTIENELDQYVNHTEAVKKRHIFERELDLKDVDPVEAAAFIEKGIRGDDDDTENDGYSDDGGPDSGTGGGQDRVTESMFSKKTGEQNTDYYDDEMQNAKERLGL